MRAPHASVARATVLSLACAAACTATVGAQTSTRIQDEIQRAVDTYPWQDATWGIVVRSLDSGETLFELNPDVPLAPASNVKLLTSAAALQVLGPDYRFLTYVLADGEIRDGVLYGDLVLYGGGDPGISDRFFRRREDVFGALVDQLVEAGIEAVEGDLVADASFFAGQLRHPGWDRRDLNEHFTAAVSALSYNENVVSFRIVPGPVGSAPDVTTVPSPSGLEVVNTASTVTSGARPRLAILRDDPMEPVLVEGRMIASSRDVWRQMTVSDPARFAGETFRQVLERRDVPVSGQLRLVTLPRESAARRITAPARGRRGARIVARHVSPPLTEYLEVVNKESNNLFAELVLRTVGRAATGVGSFERSTQAVKGALHEIGVDTTGMILLDGSGLADGNRITARAFVETMERLQEGERWPEFWASLPTAGTRRELGRMYRTAAAGNLRAKTGTIERVSALSGMVRSADGERLAFSILVNGARSQSGAKRVENLIGVRLASFERPVGTLPVLADAVPEPASDFTGRDRHQIAPGDDLSTIARRYGVDLSEIMRLNPSIRPNQMMPGEWIDIPAPGGS